MVPVPQGMPGVPPGLEYLTAIDQLLIKQKVELLETLINFETNNKYSVKNSMGQKVLYCFATLSNRTALMNSSYY